MSTELTFPAIKKNTQSKKYSPYSLPSYMLDNYWWAYLSPIGVQFFDHGFMVNRILWGQYHAIADDAVKLITTRKAQQVAGISSAYGSFFPKLAHHNEVKRLYLFDIAPIQIERMSGKISAEILAQKCQFFIGDAEQIALSNQSVDTAVLFFLLHELPKTSRTNVLAQAIAITKKGGRIIIADYAPFGQEHLFHQNKLLRGVFEKMEPFLANFWCCDLFGELQAQAKRQGRKVTLTHQQHYFSQFYRLLELSVD